MPGVVSLRDERGLFCAEGTMTIRGRVVVFLLLGSAASASAQTATEEHRKAVAAFQEARALVHAGRCDQAIPKLQASLSFEPSVGARLSLADCYQDVDPLAAWRQLKEAERLAYTKHDDRVTDAVRREAALVPKLASLHIVMAPATADLPGLEVRLDDTVVDRFDYGADGIIAVYPGRHRLTVSAPGRRPLTLTTEASVGASTTATIDLEEPSTQAPAVIVPEPRATNPVVAEPAPRPHPVEASGTSVLAMGRGGGRWAGAVGLIVGTVTGALVLSKRSSLQASCGAFSGGHFVCPTAAQGSVQDTYGAARTLATASTAAFVAGGALLASGIILYVAAPRSTTALGVAPSFVGAAGVRVLATW